MEEQAEELRLDFRSDPRLLIAVRGMAHNYFIAQGYSDERAHELVLALDEACTNAMRHSYEGDCTQRIYMAFCSGPEWIEVVLRDDGRPFNPGTVKPRSPGKNELKPGGLGLSLIREVFDDVEYIPGAECGNRVVMRTRRPADTDNAKEG